MSDEIPEEQENNRSRYLFKPGQSGNPAGRPKGVLSLKEIAIGYSMPKRQALVEHIYQNAIAGDGNVNAKWASMFIDLTGEGGTLKLQVEHNGPWANVMAALIEKVEGHTVDAESVRLLDVPDVEQA